jgi:hypothetical protein
MFRKFAAMLLMTATVAGGIAIPAEARDHDRRGYSRHYDHHRDYRRGDYRRGNYRHNYSRRCRDKGNGGLAIGAVAGGLLGNTVAGRGDKTLGTVLGAAGGGLLGRSIDRNDGRRC